jgi:membrane-anchored protein YejM (alkaline phosphatase superfamily)
MDLYLFPTEIAFLLLVFCTVLLMVSRLAFLVEDEDWMLAVVN